LLLFSTALKSEDSHDKNYNTNLQIINNKNAIIGKFKVKIVSDEKNREIGLMFVKYLPKNHGMLFKFENEQIIHMWMKNTKIPLDMIFIDKNNKIVNIKSDAVPESLQVISSEKEADKVLEINGGLCRKLNINIGDLINI